MEHKKTEKSYFIFETSLMLSGSNHLMIISAPSSVTPHKKLYKEEWSTERYQIQHILSTVLTDDNSKREKLLGMMRNK